MGAGKGGEGIAVRPALCVTGDGGWQGGGGAEGGGDATYIYIHQVCCTRGRSSFLVWQGATGTAVACGATGTAVACGALQVLLLHVGLQVLLLHVRCYRYCCCMWGATGTAVACVTVDGLTLVTVGCVLGLRLLGLPRSVH